MVRQEEAELPAITAEQEEQVNQLILQLASVVDEYGGLCRLNLVTMDEKVRKLRADLPADDHRFKVTRILEKESQYVTLFDNKDKVATAAGYEAHFLDINSGDVTKEGLEHLRQQKEATKDLVRGAPIATADKGRGKDRAGKGQERAGKGQERAGKGQTVATVVRGGQNTGASAKMADKKVIDSAQKLFDASISGTDGEVEHFYKEVRQARVDRRLATSTKTATTKGAGKNAREAPVRGQKGGAAENQDQAKGRRERPERTERPERREGDENILSEKSCSANESSQFARLTPDELEQISREDLLEDMMRVSAAIIEAMPNRESCLSKLADAPGISPLRNIGLANNPFTSLFTTCYPSLFSTRVDERNQTYVSITDKIPTGICEPEVVPEPTAKRIRSGLGRGPRGFQQGDEGNDRKRVRLA